MYYIIFCEKFLNFPRTLTVAWDWHSFFSLLAYIVIRVRNTASLSYTLLAQPLLAQSKLKLFIRFN